MSWSADFVAEDAYKEIRRQVRNIKDTVESARDESAENGITALDALEVARDIANFQLFLGDVTTGASSTPGLEQYVRSVLGNPTFSLQSSVDAINEAAGGLQAWILAALTEVPNNSGRYVTESRDIFAVSYPVTYTVAQTTGFRNECNDFLTSIV